MTNSSLIYINCSNKIEAEKIAKHLVKNNLVACANIGAEVESYYLWNEKVESDKEVILLLKTAKSKFDEVEKEVKSLHSYDCPCIISIDIAEGSKDFIDWIENSVN